MLQVCRKREGVSTRGGASERDDLFCGDLRAVQRNRRPVTITCQEPDKLWLDTAAQQIIKREKFRGGELVQSLNQITGLGKVVALDIKHRYLVRDDISDDAIAGLGNDHVRGAQQIAILPLHFGQHRYIALALRSFAGADEMIIS